jgi:hypothetical protein
MTGRKEEFDRWIKSVLDNCKAQYIDLELLFSTEALKDYHWNKLWRIFESNIESQHNDLQQQEESISVADLEAREVILNAHGQSSSDLDLDVQMDHYMNSGNYD